MSSSKLPETTSGTDLNNQEVSIDAQHPSPTTLPVGRPQSPTPSSSRKASTNLESSTTFHAEQSHPSTSIKDNGMNHLPIDDNRAVSPTLNKNESYSSGILNENEQSQEQERQNFELSVGIISSGSRKESANKYDQPHTSEVTSASQTKLGDDSFKPSTSRPISSRSHLSLATDEQSKLIKPGEQLQVPTSDIDNERTNSPPSSTLGINSITSMNPLLDSAHEPKDEAKPRPPSETHRKSSTDSAIDNEKVIDREVSSSSNLKNNDANEQEASPSEQKSPR